MQVRLYNKFGRRFISLSELRNYTVDLDLGTHSPSTAFMEFLEREGLLAPISRVQFSPEILRRFEQEEEPNENVFLPVEPDGPTLNAAVDLFKKLNSNQWGNSRIYGESNHSLDIVANNHAPFVVKEFSPVTFTPWDDLKTPIYEVDGREVRSREGFSPSYYHYWQVFWLATILRSGFKIYYPIDDNEISNALLLGDLGANVLSGRLEFSFNIEARNHLNELRDFKTHFEMVGYFQAYSHHALQVHISERHDETGRLSYAATRVYRQRQRDIASQALQNGNLSADDLVEFIGKQTEW